MVRDLLAEGFNLLSARMKSGKTVFNTNLAIAQATGGVFLNHYRLDPAGVLYLDLLAVREGNLALLDAVPADAAAFAALVLLAGHPGGR